MQKISISEFSRCCSAKSYSKFILSTANQDWDRIDNTLHIELEFNSISISYNPNVIRLSYDENFVSFERVKYIRIQNISMIGVAYAIVCDNISSEQDDIYTVIAR